MFPIGAIHKGCSRIFNDFLPSSLLSIRTQTLNDTGFFSKSPTPNIHLHQPSHYTNTKKVSHKVKYLLARLIEHEHRERINIYLKISDGNWKIF